MPPQPPDFPAGPFQAAAAFDSHTKQRLIVRIRNAPSRFRDVLARLTEAQLDAIYKNWTIRQIVHHLADSHIHSYIRFKWALTEDNPTIKAYEEADWVLLDDSRCGEIEPPIMLLSGLHAKWVQLLALMPADQLARTFVHPQTGETVSLWLALNYYPWHAQHHTGQILWLRDRHGW